MLIGDELFPSFSKVVSRRTVEEECEKIVDKLKDNPEIDIVVASGDMDTLQLVKGKKVRVYTLKKGIKDTIIYFMTRILAIY